MPKPETSAQFLAQRFTVVPFILIATFFIAGVPPVAQAQTYNVIYNFTGKAGNGASP